MPTVPIDPGLVARALAPETAGALEAAGKPEAPAGGASLNERRAGAVPGQSASAEAAKRMGLGAGR